MRQSDQQIVRVLRRDSECTVGELAYVTQLSESTVRKALTRLEHRGTVNRFPKPIGWKGRDLLVFSIAPR